MGLILAAIKTYKVIVIKTLCDWQGIYNWQEKQTREPYIYRNLIYDEADMADQLKEMNSLPYWKTNK